jgi:signal transduction histidine kinase
VARNEWKYVAEMETDLDPSLPPVPCLPGELNQVFLNLIINAAHAVSEVVGKESGEKGVIRVSTKRAGEVAEIRISDTGPGIPQEIQGRVFDPFFTTKEVGKGTGQGLAICRSVVTSKHHGSIRFETEKNKGTIFIIRLPISQSNR